MTACACICHSNGAHPPACNIPGGCGPHDETAKAKPCARGPRCSACARDQAGDWQPAPAIRDLCRACETAVADALDAAPSLYRRLRAKARDRVRGAALGERVSTSPSRSFGLSGHPLWLSETLHWTVTAWADEVITTADRPAVDRAHQPEAEQVDDACLLLARYLAVWLAHRTVELQVTIRTADPEDPKAPPTDETVTIVQSGWEACAWLIDWHWQAEKALGLDPLTHWLPEPCPQCDVPGVCRRRDGSKKVECTCCGKSWTLEMWETFVHAWIGGAAPPVSAGVPSWAPGPRSAADGQDARRGTAAHTFEGIGA